MTLNDITIDQFDMYPLDNPPQFDDLVFIVISEGDEQASHPDAIGDLWGLRHDVDYDLDRGGFMQLIKSDVADEIIAPFEQAVQSPNPVSVKVGDCKRCGHNGTVFYKYGTASYCWDCFVDCGLVKHYEYDDIMDEAGL